MCKIIVSETLFDRKRNAKKNETLDLGVGVHVTYVCEHGDVEHDLGATIALMFGQFSLFEQDIECNNYSLSECGRTHDPEKMGLEKAYITLASGETVLVTLARVQYNENLKPRFCWQVFYE